MNEAVEAGVRTDAGGREDNEDACAILTSGLLEVIVLADGAGGHASGEVAAQEVVRAVSALFSAGAPETDLGETVRAALHAAHRAVRDKMKTHAKLRDMRSTALLVLGTANEAWIGHVGDSRAYLVREGRAERLTRDDTLVQSLVDLGQLSDEAAKTHSKANVLMQSVGDPKALEYHVRGPIEVRANDRIIACSDGLWEVMTDADLATQASQGDPDEVAARLVKLALASNASDNVTVGVMHWRASGARPLTAKHRIVLPAAAAKRSPTKKRRSARVEVLVLLSLLAIVAGAFLARMYRDRHAARPVPADISR